MRLTQLLRLQWAGYRRTHQSRLNLAIHTLTVPMSISGTVLAGYAIATFSFQLLVVGLAANGLALGLQGLGHRFERNAPEPFDGFGSAAVRVLCEQWVTFPRFLLTGSWRDRQ